MPSEEAQATQDQGRKARRLRWLELILVLFISFSGSLFTSLYSVFTDGSDLSSMGTHVTANIAYRILVEISSLALLIYVLFRQGRKLSAIGLTFSWKDILRSLALWVVASVVSNIWYALLYYSYYFATGHILQRHLKNIEFLTAPHTAWGFALLLIYATINPFREELIVRAYAISELWYLTNRPTLAIMVSVGLQVAYHLYQGVLPALSYTLMFLVFSIYYAKTQRILPVALAHLYFDLGSLLRF